MGVAVGVFCGRQWVPNMNVLPCPCGQPLFRSLSVGWSVGVLSVGSSVLILLLEKGDTVALVAVAYRCPHVEVKVMYRKVPLSRVFLIHVVFSLLKFHLRALFLATSCFFLIYCIWCRETPALVLFVV